MHAYHILPAKKSWKNSETYNLLQLKNKLLFSYTLTSNLQFLGFLYQMLSTTKYQLVNHKYNLLCKNVYVTIFDLQNEPENQKINNRSNFRIFNPRIEYTSHLSTFQLFVSHAWINIEEK